MTTFSRLKCSDEKPDYLSQLSDALLSHILSFLPTRSAVKTSVLSKRWKEIWTIVPVLDFTDLPSSVSFRCLNPKQVTYFRNFIDKVLACNNETCIQRFQLDAFEGMDVDHLNLWIDNIMRREIREIHLVAWRKLQLPMSLPGRERLVVLKIGGDFLIDIPASLHLPSLEIMYVSGLIFLGDGLKEFLSSGCPILRELTMVGCSGLNKLSIYSLSLKKLEIRSIIWRSDDADKYIDVKSPNVECLVFEDNMADYDFGEMSTLVQAKLVVSHKKDQLIQLMRKIPSVEKLVLGHSAVDCFGPFNGDERPVFMKLTHLEIGIGQFIFPILKSTPNLVHLTIDVEWSKYWRHIASRKTVPKCLLSLQTMEIQCFGGFERDTEIVGYYLKNAKDLKEMKFHMHDTSTKSAREAYDKLLELEKASAACQVVFCSSCDNSS